MKKIKVVAILSRLRVQIWWTRVIVPVNTIHHNFCIAKRFTKCLHILFTNIVLQIAGWSSFSFWFAQCRVLLLITCVACRCIFHFALVSCWVYIYWTSNRFEKHRVFHHRFIFPSRCNHCSFLIWGLIEFGIEGCCQFLLVAEPTHCHQLSNLTFVHCFAYLHMFSYFPFLVVSVSQLLVIRFHCHLWQPCFDVSGKF